MTGENFIPESKLGTFNVIHNNSGDSSDTSEAERLSNDQLSQASEWI